MLSKIFGLSLFSLVAAQSFPFNITAPSSQIWLVADSFNTISWTPCQGPVAIQHPQINMAINNPNPSILVNNLTVLGAVPSTDCSKSFTPTSLPSAPNYQMIFFDSTTNDVIAVSDPFSIMPEGSAYATPSTSSTGPSPTGGSSGSSGNSTSGSGSNTKNAAARSSSLLIEKTVLALVGVAGVATFL